jgi:NADPH:quinone reductase-like Zn-dependent oxidoreductase/AcrR family transcriptional regulator
VGVANENELSEEPPSRPRPATSRALRREKEILDAAAKVFSTKGYLAANLDDVASLVGMLKGSLYYYIDSKEDLLYRLTRSIHQDALQTLERTRAVPGSAADRLDALVRFHFEALADNIAYTRVFYNEFTHLTGDRYEEIVGLRRSYEGFVQSLIEEGQISGLFCQQRDPHVMMLAVLTLLNSVQQWYRSDGGRTVGLLADEYAPLRAQRASMRSRATLHTSSPETTRGVTNVKAWKARALGEPREVMTLEEVPAPIASPGEVVVDVHAVGLNFPDLLQLRGGYQVKPTFPYTVGSEIAGVVSSVGEDVLHVRAGDRIAASVQGGLCEFVAVREERLFKLPEAIPLAKAAALISNYTTTYYALHDRAHLEAGETVLVHAGAGGIGSSAIQLAKAAGAHVIATAGGPEKVTICKTAGADEAIDYLSENIVERVRELTNGDGVDVVYDPVGGDVSTSRDESWGGTAAISSSASQAAGSRRHRSTTCS